MFGLFLTLAPIAALLIAFAWGIFIGIRNVRIRFIGVAVSFVIALISVLLVKNISYAAVSGALAELGGGSDIMGELLALLDGSEVLRSALVSFGGAFIAPLVFCVTFVVCAIATWIIGWIVSLILHLIMKKSDAKRMDSWWRVLIYATVQVMLTFFVLLTPIVVYGDFIAASADIAESVELDIPFVNTEGLIKACDDLDSSLTVKVYRAAGGNSFCKSITSFKIGKEKTDITGEIESIGSFAGNVYKLSKHKLVEYDEEDAELIREIGDSFGDSLVITTVTCEIIHVATDAWLDDSEKTKFMGTDKPVLEGTGFELFSDAVDHIILAFHDDSEDSDAICTDIDTIANVVGILAEDEVFSDIGKDNGTALVNRLSNGNTVKKLVEELGNNPSFKILIADIANIGMRAIGTTLNIPENSDKIYMKFTEQLAVDINDIKDKAISHDDKVAMLADAITVAFAESGNSLQIEGDAVKLYAETLLEDLADYSSVTPRDIEEFFRVYSVVSSSLSNDGIRMCGASLAETENDSYYGAAYAGKTLDELKTETGAGLLACIMNDIVALKVTSASDEEFTNATKEIIKNYYVVYAEATGKDVSAAEEWAESVEIVRDNITEDSITKIESMSSSDALEKVSTVITIESLLVDPGESANLLDSKEAVEKEAEAIQQIFGSTSEIIVILDGNDSEGLELLTQITDSLGSALDNLSVTGTVGDEKTADLITAVFQSETVRDAADLDIEDATELAREATKPNEDGSKTSYTDTMNSVSAGVNVVNKLKDENATLEEEDVRELLDNMTPSTAGMVKVYMTEKRVSSMGVPESRVPRATEMIRNLLSEMAQKDKYADTYEKETKGILKLFNIVTAAKNNESSKDVLFNTDGKDGCLGVTADECIFDLLDSRMASNAIINTLKTDSGYDNDPFDLDVNKDSSDYISIRNAIDEYYSSQAVKDEYLEQRTEAVGALFGIND